MHKEGRNEKRENCVRMPTRRRDGEQKYQTV